MKRLRNSVRDLFWLGLLLSALVGWWADRARLKEELETANYNKGRIEEDLYIVRSELSALKTANTK